SHFRSTHWIRRLRLLGDLRPDLLRRAVPRSLHGTLPGDVVSRRRTPVRLRTVRRLVHPTAGHPHPGLARRFPADMLLLPQSVLSLLLALAAGLRGERAAQAVHR